VEIGKEGEPFTTEPVEDPYRKDDPVEAPEYTPEPVPDREKVPA
jgi:hypothetical protein